MTRDPTAATGTAGLRTREIFGLPIDNASMTGGCAAPTITDGQILSAPGPRARHTTLERIPSTRSEYTLAKGGNNINSVAPGVFFYYGTISVNRRPDVHHHPDGQLWPLPRSFLSSTGRSSSTTRTATW